jgi:GT2 family glycosyltransferase
MSHFATVVLATSVIVATARGLRRGISARRKREDNGPPYDGAADGAGEWPSVTVIVPAWEERETLKYCLATLARQDYGDFSTIIIAGGRDGTFEEAAAASRGDPRITVIAQGPHGKNSALNTGVQQAGGEVLVFLDADSVIRPGYLRALVRPLLGHSSESDVGAVTGNYVPLRRAPLAHLGEMAKVAENEVRGRVMLNGSGGIAIRRALLMRLGGFPEGPFADDWDLSVRLSAKGYITAYSAEALVITQRPATLREWWSNELRWRRIHLRSVFRLRDVLFTGPGPLFRHLYPYAAAWGTLIASALALAARITGPPPLRRLVGALWSLVLAQSVSRDVTTYAEGYAYSRHARALVAAPLVPLATVLGWCAAILATLTPGKAPVQAKGPRPVPNGPEIASAIAKEERTPSIVPAWGPALNPPGFADWSGMDDSTSTISIAIVNHNTREHLAACLESAAADPCVPVLVVDNASTDDSAEMVRREFPWVDLHVLPANRGFAAGANTAVRLCTTPYVLLLNSDTRLAPNSASALADYLDAHPSVAVAGPRLLNPDGSLQHSCHAMPTPLNELLRWTFLGVLAARMPFGRDYYLARWSHSYARPVGWLVGAALAIRRGAFDTIGGFDESFFMYSEEVDLMYRLHAARWDVHFAPVTDVIHVGGASTVQQRAAMTAQLFSSMYGFYSRHYSGHSLLQLKITLSYLMLRNLARDFVRLPGARDDARRDQIYQDIGAWRRVLATVWD